MKDRPATTRSLPSRKSLIFIVVALVLISLAVISFLSHRGNCDTAIPPASSLLISNIDKIRLDSRCLFITGWAYVNGLNAKNNRTVCTLTSKGKLFRLNTIPVTRPDLPKGVGNDRWDLEKAGFHGAVCPPGLTDGSYRIGIIIENNSDHFFSFSPQSLIVKSSEIKLIDGFIADEAVLDRPEETLKLAAALDIITPRSIEGIDYLELRGWAYVSGIDSKNTDRIVILFRSTTDGTTRSFTTNSPSIRADVTRGVSHKENFNHDNSGFSTLVPLDQLPDGTYQVEIVIQQKNGPVLSNTPTYPKNRLLSKKGEFIAYE